MTLPAIKVRAWKWRLLVFTAVFTGLFCIKLWRPERQIELHQKNFLSALEDRRWGRVEGQFCERYSDRFGHNRATAMKDLREVLQQFFALTIKSQGSQTEFSGDTATVTVNLTITGSGTGATEWITNEVNRLPAPWVFTWQKVNVFPWSWELMKVDNPSLTIPDRSLFDPSANQRILAVRLKRAISRSKIIKNDATFSQLRENGSRD